ncbi:YybH family protein [Haliea sp. E17]|uniref:YybH family protein n=1 Tax=Haliea sp. E17 TaxID=3401576 RepID=UPI003AB0F93E
MKPLYVAEFEIRQLHARYADAVWRKDLEAFGNCFTGDAEWRIGGKILRGRSAIVENLARLLPNFERVLMTFRTPLVDMDEDGDLSSRTYVTENNIFANGKPGSSIGIYYERFVEEDYQLRFKWRLFQTHYLGPADITGPLYQNPDFGPPPQMPPLDAPTIDHTGLSKRAWQKDN